MKNRNAPNGPLVYVAAIVVQAAGIILQEMTIRTQRDLISAQQTAIEELTKERAMPDFNRPEPGATTVREIRIRMCAGCGCAINDHATSAYLMCKFNCKYDGEVYENRDYFTAVYERTEKFLRDEPCAASAPVRKP